MANVSSSNSQKEYPQLRLKSSDGCVFPAWKHLTMGRIYKERKTPGNENLPILTVSIHSGVSDGSLDEDELGKRVKRSADKSLYKQALTGDLVFNMMRAWQGALGVVKTPGMVSPAYIVAEPNDEVYPLYMDYLFSTPQMINRIHRLSYGVTDFRLRLYWDSFASIDCCIPQVEEQKRIANFLSQINQRIEAQKRLVTALKSYKRGVIEHLLSVSSTSWPSKKLGDILHERKAYCEKDGTYPHVTLSKDGVYGKTERYDRDYLVASDDKKYKVTHLGDICYNPANLKFGVICMNTFGDAIFSPIYVTFEVAEWCDRRFVAESVMRPDFIKRALKYQQGTVYERMAVSPEDLLSLEIPVPPQSEQIVIADMVDQINHMVSTHERLLQDLVALKSGLLQKMFI